MKKVLILASGNGSNAANISKFLKKTDSKNEIKVLCNVERAGVFEKMKKLKIPCILIQISIVCLCLKNVLIINLT